MKKMLLLFTFLFSISLAYSQPTGSKKVKTPEEQYQWRTTQSNLYGTYIPKDLTDVFVQLNRLVDDESKAKFKNASEEEVAKKLHFSLGRWMMTNWSFYEGSRLTIFLNQLELYHPDDMARFLIITYHRNLNKTALDVKALVEQLKQRRDELRQDRLLQGKTLYEDSRQIERPDSLKNGKS